MLASLGRTGFEEASIPVPSKSEFGMDTLTRPMKGWVGEDGENLQAFVASLGQGDTYVFNEITFYLQTWSCNDSTPEAIVTLNYKGLSEGGTPMPDVQTEISPASGSISKSYAGENNGQGRIYKTITLWRYQFTAPDLETVTSDQPVGTRDVYTTGVTMEFTYDAVQTVYRYVTQGKPSRPRYFTVDIPRVPTIKRSRITTADGSVYGNNAPGALTADLTPTVQNKVVGFTSKNVIGSPYYECVDIVRRELGENESDTEGSFGGET